VSRGVEVERLHAKQMGEKSSLDRKKLKKVVDKLERVCYNKYRDEEVGNRKNGSRKLII